MECVRKLARRCDSAKYVGSRNHAGQTSRALAESLSLWSVVALLDEVFEDTTGISPPLPARTGPDLRRPIATSAGAAILGQPIRNTAAEQLSGFS